MIVKRCMLSDKCLRIAFCYKSDALHFTETFILNLKTRWNDSYQTLTFAYRSVLLCPLGSNLFLLASPFLSFFFRPFFQAGNNARMVSQFLKISSPLSPLPCLYPVFHFCFQEDRRSSFQSQLGHNSASSIVLTAEICNFLHKPTMIKGFE